LPEVVDAPDEEDELEAPNDEEEGEESGSEDDMYENIDSLTWYDYMKEIAITLVTDYDDDAFDCFKEITDEESFDLACGTLADQTTKTRIDQLGTRIGLTLAGTKKTRLVTILRWKAGL
jgi:hypothetical protein